MSKREKVICVGTPPELIQSRRLVLQTAGYEVTFQAAREAAESLRSGGFDVVIVSSGVSQKDRFLLRDAASDVRFIQLESFTDPRDLLQILAPQPRATQ